MPIVYQAALHASAPLRMSSLLCGRYATGSREDALGDLNQALFRTSFTEQTIAARPDGQRHSRA